MWQAVYLVSFRFNIRIIRLSLTGEFKFRYLPGDWCAIWLKVTALLSSVFGIPRSIFFLLNNDPVDEAGNLGNWMGIPRLIFSLLP